MNILLMTYGTRGDVQPFVALGVGLSRAGHRVTLATSDRFRDMIERHGLAYAHMSDDLLALLYTGAGKDIMENGRGVFSILSRSLKLLKQVGPIQRALFEDGWTAAQACKPDIIVFHQKVYGGPHYAAKLGVPAVLAMLIPMVVPTGERPNIGFPKLPLGRWYNRATYRFVNAMVGVIGGKDVRRWREANGLPKGNKISLMTMPDGRDMPLLHAISRHVVPRPADWPQAAQMTGYWFLDDAQNAPPSSALEAFLAAGPPPVYIGFGSMAGKDPAAFTTLIVEAVKAANVRAIIATGGGAITPVDLPDTILQIDQAPHDWLFPKVAAIVHHGGAGTTAAAFRAGVPAVIVPFFGDQPFWAERAFTLGVASKPIPKSKLTAQRLASAITEVTTTLAIRDAAKALGAKIRAEDGVAEAIRFIEGEPGV